MQVSAYALLVGLAAGATLVVPVPAAAADFIALHSFTGGSTDGANPLSQLTPDGSGALYGTTFYGGPNFCVLGWGSDSRPLSSAPCGTVFAMTPPTRQNPVWYESIISTLGSVAFPAGRLTLDMTSGAFYGVASGTEPSCGRPVFPWFHPSPAIFQLARPTSRNPLWTVTKIYQFSGCIGVNSRLIIDEAGNLFGSTGGLLNGQTPSTVASIFELSPPVAPSTSWTYSTLFEFPSNGIAVNINIDSRDRIFGTTSNGGTYNEGTVFMLKPPAGRRTAWTETVLYNFTGGADGGNPQAGVGIGRFGSLWGTAAAGGIEGNGVVFRLTLARAPPWSETTLYSFRGGSDGGSPTAEVRFNNQSESALYGVTPQDFVGGEPLATVFKLTPPAIGTTWTQTILHRFESSSSAPVYVDAAGDVFGTTQWGGAVNLGIVYEIPAK
jgi:hypothetical protein